MPGDLNINQGAYDGYREAILWAEEDQLLEEMKEVGVEDPSLNVNESFSPSAIAKMKADIAQFYAENGEAIEQFKEEEGVDDTQVGHSFWLTRQRYGAGFSDFSGEASGVLAENALGVAFPSLDMYVGDEGLIYFMGFETQAAYDGKSLEDVTKDADDIKAELDVAKEELKKDDTESNRAKVAALEEKLTRAASVLRNMKADAAKLSTFKITYENGDTVTTNMASHVTLEDAKRYYIGQYFTFGSGEEGDPEHQVKAVDVEELKPFDTQAKKKVKADSTSDMSKDLEKLLESGNFPIEYAGVTIDKKGEGQYSVGDFAEIRFNPAFGTYQGSFISGEGYPLEESDSLAWVIAHAIAGHSKESSTNVEASSGVWSEEQAKAVADLDAEFESFLTAEGIEPYSKESADAWKSGFQDRFRKIFGKDVEASRRVKAYAEVKETSSGKSYSYQVDFEFEAKTDNYTQHLDSHLSQDLGSSYAGDIGSLSVHVDRDGDIYGSGIYYGRSREPLDMNDIGSNIESVFSENSTADWGVVRDIDITILTPEEEIINPVPVEASRRVKAKTIEELKAKMNPSIYEHWMKYKDDKVALRGALDLLTSELDKGLVHDSADHSYLAEKELLQSLLGPDVQARRKAKASGVNIAELEYIIQRCFDGSKISEIKIEPRDNGTKSMSCFIDGEKVYMSGLGEPCRSEVYHLLNSSDSSEDNGEKVYETIVFMQDSNAEEALKILEEDGEDAAVDYLSQWDNGDGGEETKEEPWGKGDTLYKTGDLVLSYNTGVGYIGLARVKEAGVDVDAFKKGGRVMSSKKVKAEDQYKSDEAIAAEFQGAVIEKITTNPLLGNGSISGNIEVNFPEAGEHVGGGAEEISDSFIFYNFSEFVEDPDLAPSEASIAFDNWYPSETSDFLKDAILTHLKKEGLMGVEAARKVKASEEVKTIAEYEAEGYEGIDASLDIALFEYGLIWKDAGDSYDFIYGIGSDGDGYDLFSNTSVEKNVNPEEEWNFVDWGGVSNSTGMSKEELLAEDLPYLVADLLGYYGFQKVFGSSGAGGFEVQASKKVVASLTPEEVDGVINDIASVAIVDSEGNSDAVVGEYSSLEDANIAIAGALDAYGPEEGYNKVFLEIELNSGDVFTKFRFDYSETNSDLEESFRKYLASNVSVEASSYVEGEADELIASCGFSIGTSHEDVIKQNAEEADIELDWDKINEDVQLLESQSIAWLDKEFGSARAEGHDGSDDLIGTLFVYKNLDDIKDVIDRQEGLMTSSGTLDIAFDGLNYPGLVDVTINFFNLEMEDGSPDASTPSVEAASKVIPHEGPVTEKTYPLSKAHLEIFEEGKLKGLRDTDTKEVIIEPIYADIDSTYDKETSVLTAIMPDGKKESLEIVIDPLYDDEEEDKISDQEKEDNDLIVEALDEL